MNLAEEIQISLVVLLTGLLVVFAVLVFLTYIIKIYGTAIHSAATRKTKNQETKEAVEPAQLPKTQAPIVAPAVEEGIPQEVVAAIAAAVETIYAPGTHSVRSVKRSAKPARSVWGSAGLIENTRPF
mgnify:CR=1 FL=1